MKNKKGRLISYKNRSGEYTTIAILGCGFIQGFLIHGLDKREYFKRAKILKKLFKNNSKLEVSQ